MRSRCFVALAASLACSSGCTDQGRQSSVRFDVTMACVDADPEQLGCFEVRVCESDAPTECVAVAPVGGPYPAAEEDGNTRLLVPIVGGSLRFDVRSTPGTVYDVDVVAFGEAGPTGRSSAVSIGHASRVLFEGGPTTVRLFPTATSSCPSSGDVMLRRAFHQSVALSNGDALILGGITFERTSTGLSLIAGTPTASLVEGRESLLVYDAHDERLYPVTVSDGDVELLSRVMFHARWIERTTPDAYERVRLYGGVTGDSSLAFAVSSTNQYPVRVSEAGAEPAPTVDLLYDPATRSVAIQMRSGSLEAVIESERTPLPGGRVSSFGALVGSVTSAPEVVTGFGTAMETVSEQEVLPSPRRGATLTRFGSRGFVVYGGNTMQVDPEQLAQRALLLGPDGTLQTVTVPASLALSAIHTASVIDDDTVLFVGGLAIGAGTVGAPTGPVVRAYELAAGGGALSEVTVTGSDPVAERIYHSATLYRQEGATRSSVVVVGGSTRRGGSQFQPLDSAYLVDLDAPTSITALPSLAKARFGHSAALLRGGRLLVTGGLRGGVRAPGCSTTCEETTSLYLVDDAEMLVVRSVPEAVSCEAATLDAGPVRTDAGRRGDAGRDASGGSADAGMVDDAPIDDAAAM